MFDKELWRDLFSTRLNELISQCDITLEQLSCEADVSLSTLYNCMCGLTIPSTRTVLGLSRVLGVTPDQLIYFESVYF